MYSFVELYIFYPFKMADKNSEFSIIWLMQWNHNLIFTFVKESRKTNAMANS
jgi:hypothetical protein